MFNVISDLSYDLSELGIETIFSDVDILGSDNSAQIILTSQVSAGFFSYSFNTGSGSISAIDTVSLGASSTAPEGINLFSNLNNFSVGMLSDQETYNATFTVNANGHFQTNSYSGISLGQSFYASYLLETSETSFVLGAPTGYSHVGIFELNSDGSLDQISLNPVSGDRVQAITGVEIDGSNYVIHAALGANQLVSSRFEANGSFSTVSTIGASQGMGINTVTQLESISFGTDTFVIVGAAGSSSLSVVRVTGNGALEYCDHIIDNQTTRFAGLSLMETIEIGGIHYIAVSGADDGISVFSVLPSGQLVHVINIEDTVDMLLGSISGLELYQTGSNLGILATSGNEGGLQQLTINLGDGNIVEATGGTTSGTNYGDQIYGSDGADTITGRGGNDFIVDGAGSDTLDGGSGADTFVLVADGVSDTITNFNVNDDRIDLSLFAGLRHPDQISYTMTSTGARISFGGETIIIHSDDGYSMSWEQLETTLEINVDHFEEDVAEGIVGQSEDGIFVGTSGADIFVGTEGDDYFESFSGDDSIDGGLGVDTVSYEGSTQYIILSLHDTSANGGEAAGDVISNIENVVGTYLDDRIEGNPLKNILIGGDGDDKIYGLSGHDHLYGGDGEDRIKGGKNKDRIYGGDDDDRVYGNWGHDYIKGENGDDHLMGDRGRDRLFGGKGDDLLEGGADDDYLSGGKGNDVFVFDLGHDVINDLSIDRDRLELSSDLWGGRSLTDKQIINRYATVTSEGTLLHFSDDHSVLIVGIFDPYSLTSVLDTY